MKVLIVLIIAQLALSHSAQKSSASERKATKDTLTQKGLMNVQALLQDKLLNTRSNFKINGQINEKAKKTNLDDLKSSSRQRKSLAFFPFFPPPPVPFGVPPSGFFIPQNKEIPENSYSSEWLSRTEPFKKSPTLLDSPTYYIRLPPNPYIYIPGIGYVSRPPALSDPEVLENEKHQQANEVGTDVQDSFYKVPIKFISNGKPISVYQLQNGQPIARPESSLINLSKGPYVFNGKPNEIYLVAQIYDALYGDELSHFYP